MCIGSFPKCDKNSLNSVALCCPDIRLFIVLQPGVMIKSETNLFADFSLKEDNTFPARSPANLCKDPSNQTDQTLPRHTAANSIVTLQICSSNQLNLTWGSDLTTGMIRILGGLPLLTWDRDESGITMKPEIACYCYLPVFLSSFSIHPFAHAHICPLHSILVRCGNKV